MPRSAETGAGFKAGDWLWSPNGENEWCELRAVSSTASWRYLRPSNGADAAGPKDLTLYPPAWHRSRELPPPPNPV